MKVKYSEGPFYVEEGNIIYTKNKGIHKVIGDASDRSSDANEEERKGNAILFAASSEMLQIIKDGLETEEGNWADYGEGEPEWMVAARALLARTGLE